MPSGRTGTSSDWALSHPLGIGAMVTLSIGDAPHGFAASIANRSNA